MSLRRDCTLTVHVPEALGALDRPTLVKACLGVVEKRQLKCVQVPGAYYRVTFASVEAKEAFASAGLVINDINIPLQAPDDTTLVRIVRLPYEVSEQSLAAALRPFGDVSSQTFEKDKSDGLLTGTRLLRMRLNSTVPNKLHVAGYPCFAWYPGQPKVCHVCRSSEHLVADCPNRGLCRLCRKPGHVANKCPDRQANQEDQPFAWGSAPGAMCAPTADPQPASENASAHPVDLGTAAPGNAASGANALEEGEGLEETRENEGDVKDTVDSPEDSAESSIQASASASHLAAESEASSVLPSVHETDPSDSVSMMVEETNASPSTLDSDGFMTVTHQCKKTALSRGHQMISAVASLHSLERTSRKFARSRIPTKKSASPVS